MITKAIIEDVLSANSVKVRIPIFDKRKSSATSTKDEYLSKATICTLPNNKINASVGDIVYVGFEDNDTSRPVVIGYLSKDSEYYTASDLTVDNIEVRNDIKIGSVNKENIECLSGIKDNIKQDIDILKDCVGKTDYSFAEQLAGKWIDGKNLYRKTYGIANVKPSSSPTIDISDIANISDTIWIDLSATFAIRGNQSMPPYYISAVNYFSVVINLSEKKIEIHGSNGSDNHKVIVTVMYTKR